MSCEILALRYVKWVFDAELKSDEKYYSVAIATSHLAVQPSAQTLPTTHFGTKWRDRLDQSRNATWGSGTISV